MPKYSEIDDHLRSKRPPPGKETSPPNRKRELKWDPVAQRMRRPDRPPTRKQIEYLRDLCTRAGVEIVRPATRREAASMIGKRLKAQRQRERKAEVVR